MNDYALAFSRLWEWWQVRMLERDEFLKQMNARLTTECEAAYRRRFRRRAFSMVASRDQNAEEHKQIYDRLKPDVDRYLADHSDEEQQIKWALAMLAEKADVPRSDTWLSVYSVDGDAYRSQGWGAAKYAKADAESRLQDFLLHVPEGRVDSQFHKFDQPVRCAGGSPSLGWHEYHVMVPTTEIGAEILKRKPERPLREYVRDCWGRGVNPRVYLPFLPHGYEEQVGIDHFGHDLHAKQPAVAA